MSYLTKDGRQRVVVTGTGVICSLGQTSEDFWAALLAGKCGIDFTENFSVEDLEVKISSQIKDFNPRDHFPHREARRMDRSTQIALVATREALENSAIDLTEYDPYRLGVVLGSGIGGFETTQDGMVKYAKTGPNGVSPLFVPKFISNMTSGRITMEHPLHGDNFVLATACASATHAIGEAFRKVRDGYLDVCVTGGFEAPIVEAGIAGFQNMTALSMNDDPNEASRPFDLNRDGFVAGEGAGILVIESLASAMNRGAKILFEISGYGASSDGYHITSPHPEGLHVAKAMELAVSDANKELTDVDYINAHGTSTPLNDLYETVAIKRAFGEHAKKLAISSTKGHVGHLLGAAGAVEAIATGLMLKNSLLIKTRGLSTPDPELDLDYIPDENREAEAKVALSNNLGFGGQNATICLERYDG